MKKQIYFSVIAAVSIVATPLFSDTKTKKDPILLAGDSLALKTDMDNEAPVEITTVADAFKNGKVKGLLRYGAQHRDSKYHVLQDAPTDTPHGKVQAYSAIGGYLGYETAPLYNISIGATFYTSNPFLGNNSIDRAGLGGLDESGSKQSSYHVLGEAFIKYQNDENLFKVGRQEMPNYRFVSLSNIRFTPFTHEGVIYENSSLEGLKVNLAYISRQKDRNAEDFKNMVNSARVKVGRVTDANGNTIKTNIRGDYDTSNYVGDGDYTGSDKGMGMLSAIYSQDNWKVEAWDYYVTDFVNTIYLYGQYDIGISDFWKMNLAAQYVNQQDVGSRVAGNVDTWFYGLKAQANTSNGMVFFVAYNEVSYNENSYDSGTLFVRWGTPQMFNSFQVQDSELAGTKSIGVGAQFDLGALGLLDSTVIRFRYADYNMPDDLNMIDAAQDRTEATFDLRYSFTKTSGFGIFTQMDGLSIQFRLAYDNFKTDYDFEAYKAAHGFLDNEVDDDFVDARIYIDYQF
jgi:hypothetical protein